MLLAIGTFTYNIILKYIKSLHFKSCPLQPPTAAMPEGRATTVPRHILLFWCFGFCFHLFALFSCFVLFLFVVLVYSSVSCCVAVAVFFHLILAYIFESTPSAIRVFLLLDTTKASSLTLFVLELYSTVFISVCLFLLFTFTFIQRIQRWWCGVLC